MNTYALNQQTVTITADTYAGSPYVRMTLDPNPSRGRIHHATERAAMDRMIRAVWGPGAGTIRIAPGRYEAVYMARDVPPVLGIGGMPYRYTSARARYRFEGDDVRHVDGAATREA